MPALYGDVVRGRLRQQGRTIAAASRPARQPKSRRQRVVEQGEASTAEPVVFQPKLSFFDTLQQFSQPKAYAQQVMAGHVYAWGKTSLPPVQTLFVAELGAVRSLLSSDWQNSIQTSWPHNFRKLLGESSVSMTQDAALHTRMRQIIGPAFTQDAVARMLPGIVATIRSHMARWATEAACGQPVAGYEAIRLLTFDVLVNQALKLNLDAAETAEFSRLYQAFTDGFLPPSIELPITPFGRGMEARRQLQARVRTALHSPQLEPGTVLHRLAAEFGPDSEIAVDNSITLLFAGFDTTSSTLTYLLWQLARHPGVLQKLRDEQAGVQAKHGPELTPAAIQDMPYLQAVSKETLRLAQIIAYLPRVAAKPLQIANGPQIPAGCPFIAALSEVSRADPAVQADGEEFRPERWLDPDNLKTLSVYQMPWGHGQRSCLGMNLGYAELAVVMAELARSYSFAADTETSWADFPIKRPANGLPITLTPLAEA